MILISVRCHTILNMYQIPKMYENTFLFYILHISSIIKWLKYAWFITKLIIGIFKFIYIIWNHTFLEILFSKNILHRDKSMNTHLLKKVFTKMCFLLCLKRKFKNNGYSSQRMNYWTLLLQWKIFLVMNEIWNAICFYRFFSLNQGILSYVI